MTEPLISGQLVAYAFTAVLIAVFVCFVAACLGSLWRQVRRRQK